MAPDVAIVGEVRDREALPLLLTLSSGVKGFTTIHAGSARQALTRLRFICQLADTASELPMSALNTLVTRERSTSSCTARGAARGPRVTEIVAVEDLAAGPDAAQFTVTEVFAAPARRLRSSGPATLPVRLGRATPLTAGVGPRRAGTPPSSRPIAGAIG